MVHGGISMDLIYVGLIVGFFVLLRWLMSCLERL